MRGLPSPPSEVVRITQSIDVNGAPSSISHWLFAPGAGGADISYFHELVVVYLETCTDPLLQLLHSGCQLSTCRSQGFGMDYQEWTEVAPPNAGAWTGGQAQNVAVGLHWLIGDRGKGRQAVTRLPGVPDAFIDSNWRLSGTGYHTLLEQGRQLRDALNALPGYVGGTCVVGTVHRVENEAPLAEARFVPAIDVLPTMRVCTVRRRLPRGGPLSP